MKQNNLLFLLMFLLLGNTIWAQNINQTITRTNGKLDLIGICNRASLEQPPFSDWFGSNYQNYQVDKSLLKKINNKTKGVTIDIFMGTWCGDSRREVPRFYKVLDELGFSEKNIRLVNVDKTAKAYKQSPNHEEKGKLIHRVPTFIFYKKGEELGRIVEFPVSSFEMDMAQILNGLPSDPNYKVVSLLDRQFKNNGCPKEDEKLLELARSYYKITPNDKALNTYGYVLMRGGEIDKAIAAFRINAMLFSRTANVFDSLGEAYLMNKELDKALAMYNKVLSLNAEDENAQKQIQKIEEKIKQSR